MPRDPEFKAALAAKRATLRGGSRSFFAASLLLPARVSGPATVLYAFCREADDLIDGQGPHTALDMLRDRLDRLYAGPDRAAPEDRALAHVVAHHAVPRPLLDALLEGFAWDTAGRRYETLEEVQDYAARVAGAVGAMMAVLMGARAQALVARACDLGTAMQLTNIARDVGEDARAGRLYLPRTWLREAGMDPDAWLAAPRFTPAIATVVRRLLTVADVLYAKADAGIAALPWDCRPGIAAARLLYAAIGTDIARNGYDSVGRRAVVPRRRKLQLLARAATRVWTPPQVNPAAFALSLWERAGVRALPSPAAAPSSCALPQAGKHSSIERNGFWDLSAPPLRACQYLVHAVTPRRSTRRSLDDRIAWLLHLFARLGQQQTLERGH